MSKSRTEPAYSLYYQAIISCQHEQTAKLFEDYDKPIKLEPGWRVEKISTYGPNSWALLESDEPFDTRKLDALAAKVATIDTAFTSIKEGK